MTNRELLTNTNIADVLVNLNKEIPYKCILQCLHAMSDQKECYNYEHCIDCINDWLNSEVKQK